MYTCLWICEYVFPFLYWGTTGFNFDDGELGFAGYIIMFVFVIGYYGWMCSAGSMWVVVAVVEDWKQS